MPERDTIETTLENLEKLWRSIPRGASVKSASQILGGGPYKVDGSKSKQRVFWRFHIGNAPSMHEYQFFVGEFIDDRYVSGAILPHAAR